MFKPCVLSFSRILAIVFLVFIPQAEFAPVASDAQAMIYLSKFGYIHPSVANLSSGTLVDRETLNKAISRFQCFAGLKITGELNRETRKTMSLPRCGVKDRVGFGSNSRSKCYSLQETMPSPHCGVTDGVDFRSISRSKLYVSRWRVKDLTYKISKYPRRLPRKDVDEQVRNAFAVWTEHTDLTFTQLEVGKVHIEIRFDNGEHGDDYPFDGRGGTLAHAYYPLYGGAAHFDDTEDWTIGSARGTNLFQVASHQFGHSLGLSHSEIKSALMSPFYNGYDPSIQLDIDDITNIQIFYGNKSINNTNTI